MAFHHLKELYDNNKSISLNLICGMVQSDGLSISNHEGFKKLMNEDFEGNFTCSYIYRAPPVHGKIYVWSKGKKARLAYMGSANYTQSAMRLKFSREVMDNCNPQEAQNYIYNLIEDSIFCTHPEVDEYITFFSDKQRQTEKDSLTEKAEDDYEKLPHCEVSLLNNSGDLPQRSGLNWGQRPEYKREPNQAYIRLPSSVYRSNFFPPRGVHFTLLTDDGKVLICTRAQENDKAIETPHNNSLIGEYFRHRLGINYGERVTLSDLTVYGRTTLDFYKIDEETFYMDFSPNK